MKNFFLLLACGFVSVGVVALDSNMALTTFNQELTNIRTKLQAGKMTPAQAQVLLQAIQVRQNNVIIKQNNDILKGLQHEPK